MTDAARLERAKAFQSDLIAWTALHHFLSASLLRELAQATVEVCAPDQHLGDLFEDHLTGDGVTDTWSIAPRHVDSEALRFLQFHIRALAWANDSEGYSQTSKDEDVVHHARDLAQALSLGRLDFGASEGDLDRLQFTQTSNARLLIEAIGAAMPLADGQRIALDQVATSLDGLQPPLQALAFKHLGDLCVDVDAWDEAAWFYDRASARCEVLRSAAWEDFARYLSDMIRQSRALTIWVTRGASAAAPQLAAIVQAAGPTRLAKLNGSHEALVVNADADDLSDWRDLRSSTLLPPLLAGTHSAGSAVEAWQAGDHQGAHRYFWSALRRQIALASYSGSCETKALYGRALLTEVNELPGRFNPSAFELGSRLLVEAGRPKGLYTLTFSTAIVQRYVSPDLVLSLSATADRHEGVRYRRSLALIELLAKWAEALPRDETKSSYAVIGELIARTQKFEAAFNGNRNVGGQGLKLLKRLAEQRPDLRRPFAPAIAALIVQKLGSPGWWTAESGALELAMTYVDAFEPAALRNVLVAALGMLQGTEPTKGAWHITKPALQLLASTEALEVASRDPELSPYYVSSLLRYGVAQRSAGVGLLFALSRFQGDVPMSDADRGAWQLVVDEVRGGARELNNGSVTDFIRALIVGAQHAGRFAVGEALDSLVAILQSAEKKRASIAFPYAYGPVLDLLDSQAELVAAGMPAEELRERLNAIKSGLAVAWTAILERPELLAGLSIPREREPNAILVFNWSFMTRRFMTQCDAQAVLGPLLERAAALPLLSRAMHRAALSAAEPDRLENGELRAIAGEDAETFYAAVGRRLRIAQDAPTEVQFALLKALMLRCLVLGPRELDVAIFMAATPYREALQIEIEDFDYLQQLSGEWSLQMNLAPYLRAWLSPD